ncbi:single-stranded DNA-binding protein [Spirosoma litoris]
MQRVMLIGNVGQDATIKSGNGNEFITFSVAVNERFKNRDGIEVEQTQWYNCLYQPKTMAVAQYLKKGTRVYVEGKPNVTTYKNKNNETAVDFGVQVRGLELLSAANGENLKPETQNQDSKPQDPTPPTTSGESGSDDLPF